MGRRASQGIAVAVVTLWCAIGAGCSKRNGDYCCSTAADCGDNGGDLAQCASGQLCNDDGSVADVLAHACYPDPNVIRCDTDPNACHAPEPACVGGICVECASDDDCTSAEAPRCDLDLHRCGDCTGPDDCTRFGGVCGPSGACVQCTPTNPPTQSASCTTADLPVCGGDGVCRACDDHRQCSSGACDLDTGACVDAAQIAYVDDSASGGNTVCTSDAPCKSITAGLAVTRPYVVIAAGSYSDNAIFAGGRDVTLVGYGATLQAAANTPAVQISGNSGDIRIYGVTITGSPTGVNCDSTVTTATLRVELVDVVENNNVIGGYIHNCDVVMSRAIVTGSATSGFNLAQAGVDITNSVFDDNGGAGLFGALRITEPRDSPQRLAFDTITNNHSGAGGFPGVVCSAATSVTPFHSNLISGNSGATANAQVGGTGCSFEYSLVNPAFAGNMNVTGNPQIDATWHITATSPARNHGKPGTGILEDFDRQLRDATPDIGADEYVP